MPTSNLPTFLPLPEAALRFGMTEAILYKRVEAGTIAAGILSDGEIVVSKDYIVPKANNANDINDRLRTIRREDFEHLRGETITVTEAADKYRIHRDTILEWAKQKYIAVLKPGYRMQIDEADVAYCSAILAVRKQTGIRTGFSLLDKNDLPGLLKHPNLSRHRREQRVADTR